MAETAGTPRLRALGAALRRAREAAGLTMRELSSRVGIPYANISFWENARRVPRVEDVATLLTALGVPADERERLLDLARGAADKNWLATGFVGASPQLAGVMECERIAAEIVDWSPLLIPGLLQVGDYARTILSDTNEPAGTIEARVALRLARREVLLRRTPPPPHLVALIGEAALRTPIGGPEVMADQLRHVLQMSERDNITVRIVPFSAGWHTGLAGMFVLYVFEDMPSTVHLEHHRSGVFLDDDGDVAAYQEVADTIRQLAMSPEESAELITATLKEWEAA
ncbi:MAG TPA: helix-turn-helix transcriptional regulator [Pseudonocardiaceae bacterium]